MTITHHDQYVVSSSSVSPYVWLGLVSTIQISGSVRPVVSIRLGLSSAQSANPIQSDRPFNNLPCSSIDPSRSSHRHRRPASRRALVAQTPERPSNRCRFAAIPSLAPFGTLDAKTSRLSSADSSSISGSSSKSLTTAFTTAQSADQIDTL